MTLEQFKARLAARIRHKEIGLVMIVDRDGRIRWHHGRPVSGRSITDGQGFSRTHLRQVLESGDPISRQDVMITRDEHSLPASARLLYVKSLLIHPVDHDLVLYVDSGNDELDPEDIELFTSNGEALRALLTDLRTIDGPAGGISGTSSQALQMRELALAFAIEDDPVLILGETGVGKSHIAQLIHRISGRPGRLIIVDTPTLPESLFESELFGHARGSFTGATESKKGLIEAAQGGTIFLDEIAEMPMPLQAKLLRFIDTYRYRPVGETTEREVRARVIAATNRELQVEVEARRFRQDLLYRLDVLTLEIPPLRERPDDIHALVTEHERFLRGKEPGPGFWDVMLAYSWPGNVRELINVMKRAGIRLQTRVIGSEIADLLRDHGAPRPQQSSDHATSTIQNAIDAGESFWDTAWTAFLDRELNRSQLQDLLRQAYEESRHSLKDLARRLNIDDRDYPRFISALHKYRVHPGR